MHKALVALLFAVAAGSTFHDRLKSIRDEAAAQRDKLNLPREKLYAQYPTPEMTFAGDAPFVACGQSLPLAFAGRFPKGTQLVLHSDDASLSDVKVTETSAKATLRVAKSALPGPLELEAITPVSGATVFQQAAVVEEKLRLQLQFEDGWSAKLERVQGKTYDVSWTKAGQSRSSHATVTPEEGGLQLQFEMSPEQQALAQEQVAQAQTAMTDPDFQAMQTVFASCEKLPQDKQMACIQKASEDAKAIGDRMKKKQEAAGAKIQARQPHDAWACSRASLRGSGGQLAGTADCFAQQKVTARVECLGR
jgi:hypothetical protein